MILENNIFPYLNYISNEILLIGILSILIIWYSSKKQSYWKDRNVPYEKPLPFFGSLLDYLRKPYHEYELQTYFSMGPVYGRFEGNRPVLVVGDPKLLRDILVKDFTYFVNRRPIVSGDKISDQSLIFIEGEAWKRIRTIVSPTFSSGKLKGILNIFKESSKTLVQNFKEFAQKNEPIDVKGFCGTYSMDVIASAAFSTKLSSHNDPENDFVQCARKLYTKNVKYSTCLILLFPSWLGIIKFLKLGLFNSAVTAFFGDLAAKIIFERKRTKQTRNDFLQLLIDTTEEKTANEKMEEDENDYDITNNYDQELAGQKIFPTVVQKNLTKDEVLAQCFFFFVAAYDTTSVLMSYTFYLLAVHENIQEKSYQEIAQCLQKTNGEVTYDALTEMKYLDNILAESLRLYPPVIKTTRRAGKDYELGNTGIVIKEGIDVIIPIFALHRDPKYYPDPEKFDPDRFTDEERAKRNPYVYLPFGHGPRNCMGLRFALLNAKVCLVHVISSFRIKTCSKTEVPVKVASNSFVNLAPKDVTLVLEIRNDSPLVFT